MKKIIPFLLTTVIVLNLKAQDESVFRLMQRRDLNINEIKELAEKRFQKTGTGKGSGFKQFSRWLEEMKYHADENGNFRETDYDRNEYKRAGETMLRPGGNLAGRLTTGSWTELGPFNGNPGSRGHLGQGRINCIAIHPSNPSVVYVAAMGGGIWKSTNGGTSWTVLTDDESRLALPACIVIAPSNPSILYAGTLGSSNGVLKSVDAGLTWTSTANNSNSPNTTVPKILVDKFNPDIVFAGDRNGIFRSVNGGATWTKVLNGDILDMEYKPDNPSIVYASGYGNATTGIPIFHRSTDGGITWAPVANGLQVAGRTQLAVSPANPELIYLVQEENSGFGRMYKSTDAGISFTVTINGDLTAGHNFFGYDITGTSSGGQADYAMALAVNPINSQEVHIGSVNMHRSTNGATGFSPVAYWVYQDAASMGYGYVHADIHYLEWIGNTLYCGSDGGIFKSTNGGLTWTDLSAGIGMRMIYRISSAKTNADVYAIGCQDNGNGLHRTSGWIDWSSGDGTGCAVSSGNPNNALIASAGGFLSRTTDGGITTEFLNRPSPGAFITPVKQHPVNNTTFFAGFTGVYKTTDIGTTWTKISGNNINTTVNCLAVAASNANCIYASSLDKLYITTNGGTTWSMTTLPAQITAIAVSPLNPNKVWVTVASGTMRVMKSTNTGSTFTNISGNLPALTARSIVVDDNFDEGVYVGMNFGVYFINKNTSVWTELTDNLPLTGINDIEIHQGTSKVRVATNGRGVWEMPVYLPPCNTPTGLSVSLVTYNSARATWDAVSGAQSYTVEYKGLSNPFPITINNVTSNVYNMANLKPEDFYYIKVKTNCDGNSSAFSGQATFITPPNPCSAPSDLIISSGVTAVSVNWGAVNNALYYQVRYRELSSSVWTYLSNLTGTSCTITGLTGGTDYRLEVWSYCSVGSPNFSFKNFTTRGFSLRSVAENGPAKDTESTFTVERINIFPNPVERNLFIVNNQGLFAGATASLTDINGRTVLQKVLREEKSALDLSGLPGGIYILRVSGKKNFFMAKVIKQ